MSAQQLRSDDDHDDEAGDTAVGGAVPDLTSEQEDLIKTHLGLARALARRFAYRGEALDDLEQVAMLALVKVSRRFDETNGASFSTYATTSILGELKRYFRDHSWVMRVPRRTQETYLAFKRASESLEQDLGRPATIPELSAYLRVSEEAVLEAIEAGRSFWPSSLDTPPSEGAPAPIDELTADGDAYDMALDRQRLRELLPALGERERLIISLLFFEGWTQQRVADRIGVSQMQVSRLLHRILEHLRTELVEA
jgi:RNA polymerase sigma-B factor